MDIKHPRIGALFDASIAEFSGQGVIPTPRQCVWLHALCSDVVMPDRADVCAWLPPVVRLGDVDLYPLTVQARLWLDEYASKWWDGHRIMDVLSTAWALAHGHAAGAFDTMTNKLRARLVISVWAGRLPYSFAQINEALNRYFGVDSLVQVESPLEKVNADPMEWGEVLARAAVVAHKSPSELMLWRERELLDVLRAARKSETDQGECDSDKIRALESLRLAKQEIIKAFREASANELAG